MKFRIRHLSGHKHGKNIVFDINGFAERHVSNTTPGLWYSNMSVKEAKALSKQLKAAIKQAQR